MDEMDKGEEERMTRVIMHGCNGKMGQVITGLCKNDPEMEIVSGIDRYDGIENEYPVFTKAEECHVEADAVIDFSTAGAIDTLLSFCLWRNLPLVLCTTGLSEEQLQEVEQVSKDIPILKSANMSLGINLLLELLQKAAQTLAPAGFDMEIVEKHHNSKIDAPSGTALALAESMNEALDNQYFYQYDRSKERKARASKEIGIQAVRGGNIVGEHEVIFAGFDEVITFSHTAYSRGVFGNGAIQAAKFLKGKERGIYSMEDVIKA
jgi:4-hydroxy-tetrahydrodipicolinate reductase